MTKTNKYLQFCLVLAVTLASLLMFRSHQAYALSQLRITEIMYDPSGNGTREFIEFYNGSDTTANLAGWSMFGVDFVFPGGSSLAPGAYTVIARNQAALQASHPGVAISGQYGGKLRGEGELIRLSDVGGGSISQVSYSYGGAWPLEPRNGGPSLSLIRVSANESLAGCWSSSTTSGGTPGMANSVASGGGSCDDVAYPVTAASAPTTTTGGSPSAQDTNSPVSSPAAAVAQKKAAEAAKQKEQAAIAKATESKTIAETLAKQRITAATQQAAKQQTQKWTFVFISLALVIIGSTTAWFVVRTQRQRHVKLILTKTIKNPKAKPGDPKI